MTLFDTQQPEKEIALALDQGKKVIPVLLDDAPMPAAQALRGASPRDRKTVAETYDATWAWKTVRVPAREFIALRIERTAYLQDIEWYRSQTTLRQVDWYLPQANHSVMTWHDSYHYDYRQRGPSFLILGDHLRWEWVR